MFFVFKLSFSIPIIINTTYVSISESLIKTYGITEAEFPIQ